MATGVAIDVLDLQRQAGNGAVVELIRGVARADRSHPQPIVLQRQPAPTAPGEASLTEGMSADDADYLAQALLKDYHAFYNRLMGANTIADFTHYRLKLMQELDAIGIDGAVDRGVFDKPLEHMADVALMSEKLAAVKAKLAYQHAHATKLWAWLDGEVAKERTALSAGSFTDQSGLHILTQSYDKAKKRVAGLGDLAVAEDFVHVVDMVKQKSHRTFGAQQAVRDEEKLTAESEAFSREMAELEDDDEPGFLSKAWSVLGWDSPKDFLKDAALTVGTLGYSKYARTAKRGKRALDLAKAARMSRKLKYAKRMKKITEIGDAAKKLLTAVGDHQAEITNVLSWIKGNAASLARKIFTDLVSDAPTGGVKGAPSVAIGRITKGFIQAQVDDLLDVSEEQGKKYAELSSLSLAAGREDSARRMMRAFLSVAMRRRGLTNVIDTAIKKLASLDVPTNLKAAGINVADIAITTVAEVINDYVNGLPYVDKYRKFLEIPIETARKILQKFAQSVLGT